MTAIERTAYPRFKQQPTAKELAGLYTPTSSEMAFAQSQTVSKMGQLRILVLLKSLQRLGYFPHPDFVPTPVIQHLRSHLKLPSNISAISPLRTRRRYQQAIRTYLNIKPYDDVAQQLVADAIAKAAEVMDYPADLINVSIEELVKQRYELPAFSTLDRLAGNIRSVANTRLFERISEHLSTSERTYLDQLLLPTTSQAQATLNLLKAPAKSATLSHMQQLQIKFDQLMSFGDAKRLLVGIAPSKVKSFAAQAKVLDVTELGETL
ncbi:DUF4158 domain-containing protein [Phormidesmis priestleyi]|uniref:DUF4158 domain-containing protein n=1 Tax=Phormidesmis priestleyi TaxID=268141 RepID=UPI000932C4BA|nr:DUF4158 domain-containing protein [Phormidesmis priestleyi]